MHKLLAVDTSGPTGIVAAESEVARRVVRYDSKGRGKSGIAEFARRALVELNISPGDLSHLAVGVGPGRFIRTRVGVSFINGLAAALGLPVVQIDSLSVLALACIGDAFQMGAIRENATGGYIYAYSLQGIDDPSFEPAKPWRNPPAIIGERELISGIPKEVTIWAVDGDEPGAEKKAYIEKTLPAASVFGDAKAEALIKLAIAGIRRNRFAKYASPVYIAQSIR